MLESKFPLRLPTLTDTKTIFHESFLKIRRDRLQIDSLPPYEYYSLITPPLSVNILAITSDGDYVINQEYRHPTGQILLGCPAGFIDEDEDPIAAARRELIEETGFEAHSYAIIGSAFPYAGISGQKIVFIRALGARQTKEATLEPSEIIQPLLMSPKELDEAIAAGAELDGTLCSALFFHHLQKKI